MFTLCYQGRKRKVFSMTATHGIALRFERLELVRTLVSLAY